MRRRPLAILATFAMLSLSAPLAGFAAGGVSLEQRLAQALSGVSGARTGAIAVELASGRVVYAQNAWDPFVPASNEKLVVAFTAVGLLGPSYRFRTEVLGEGSQAGAVWRGSLVLKGYGDPTLTVPRLQSLAEAVRRLGIRRVTGAVLGDESFYDSLRTGPGWKASYYVEESPPLSALVVARDLVDHHFSARPALAAAILFNRALAKAGVAVRHEPRAGHGGGDPIATTLSAPLTVVLKAMDAESDNFTAEMVLKQLGAVAGGAGSTAAGASVVRATLGASNVPLTGVRIADGSGLSALDRLTPKALVTVLQLVWADPNLRQVLAGSFAVAGRSGTLAHRLHGVNGRVRAKTGTTDASSALSGFAHGRYAFSVIQNGNPVPTWSARRAQDRFATVLAR